MFITCQFWPVLRYATFSNFSLLRILFFVFHIVMLAAVLMPIDQLYFQISNCNVFVHVTLAYVF